MKTILMRLSLIFGVAAMGVSCTTAYDSSGRPHKVVTPEGALLGAAAAGVLAYSLGKSSKRRHHKYYHNDYGYSRHRGYGNHNYGYGSYGSGYGGCR